MPNLRLCTKNHYRPPPPPSRPVILLTSKGKEKCLCCITNSFHLRVQPNKEVTKIPSLSFVAAALVTTEPSCGFTKNGI